MSDLNESILVGKSDKLLYLLPSMANRHGLIAGATGTGKTVTLQVLAEQFSQIGIPVFMADVKGDLSGISQPGVANPRISERTKLLGLTDFQFRAVPVDLLGCLRRSGAPGSDHRERDGSAPARQALESQ